ncbi:methyl-accepting chemotaxis protein [Lachnospira pectinoschiza]|uniref:Methyl-accepting chemotaxis sensory transducer with Cache sensor n=1 Tax=Lachnospira pectinoschiza TaxID=28052 RepID=A0A1G9W595_9FIRM|nr:methyl-accepting chemotaxis protein [Lachnospira pectinoschiza]SDM79245.1 methyl-accepting chemotaxis sensory transducer with Cache sensor [Lachnospira pectinoschiza]
MDLSKNKGLNSIKGIIILFVVSVVILTSVVVLLISMVNIINTNKEEQESYREQLEKNVENQLQYLTEEAVSILDIIYADQQNGAFSEEEAKSVAANILRELRYNNGEGYFFVDTSSGDNVVLLGRDTEGTNRYNAVDSNGTYYIQEIIKQALNGGGFTDLMFPKSGGGEALPKRNYSMYFEPYDWVIGTGVYIDSIDEEVAEYTATADKALKVTLNKLIFATVIIILVFSAVGFIFGSKMANPIKKITAKLHKMASGDFSVSDEENTKTAFSKTELGVMNEACEDLQSKLRELFIKIADSADFVASASEELNASSDQSAEASMMVAESCTNVAASCSRQMDDVTSAGDMANAFKTNMNDFKDTLTRFDELIGETNSKADEGSKEINLAMKRMGEIESAVSNTSTVVSGLGDQLQTIGSIVVTISEIAEQTNLLSLNASIEAARAGEAGKGFAVVADEIRKLADESNDAASRITNLITTIQTKSDKAVSSMREGLEIVEDGTKIVSSSGQTFNNIVGMVSDISSATEQMNDIVEDLSDRTRQLATSIDEIQEMSQTVVDETSNVSAASQEQAATAQEIVKASASLAETAGELKGQVAKFTL